jgi:quinol-cytochrome oxidoreductase complex cytochrome b subunit
LWGATVITNLFSAIPNVGESIVYWLWGGFSVDNATINRFFSLHFVLPFVIAALALLHLALLHQVGSNNAIGTEAVCNKISFAPYFVIKDFFSLIILLIFIGYLVCFEPNILGHPDNYLKANAIVTPAHIVPEWYFLPFYAILRSIPSKLGGVICIGAAIIVIAFLPLLDTSKIRSGQFREIFKVAFWIFLFICIFLGWIGQKEIEEPFVTCGQIASLLYFVYLLVLLPLSGYIEEIIIKIDNIG